MLCVSFDYRSGQNVSSVPESIYFSQLGLNFLITVHVIFSVVTVSIPFCLRNFFHIQNGGQFLNSSQRDNFVKRGFSAIIHFSNYRQESFQFVESLSKVRLLCGLGI